MRSLDVTSLRVRLLLAASALTAASLHGGARADTPPKTVCLPPEATGQCPTDEAAQDQIDKMDPGECLVLDKPGATEVDGSCCYQVRQECAEQTLGCNYAGHPPILERRPLEEAGPRLLRWRDPRLPAPELAGLSGDERRRLALHWASIGAAEHASIAGFQRFTADLTAHGAPAELVARARRAALDEVRHARLAFTLASAFAGAPIGPAPRDRTGPVPLPRSLEELAIATALEGCTEETLSACLLAEALRRASDPAVVAALRRMRRDEDRHAILAWQVSRWALSRDPAGAGPVDAALERAIAQLEVGGFADPGGLERFGLLRPEQAEACRAAAIREVLEPCRQALRSSGGSPSSP